MKKIAVAMLSLGLLAGSCSAAMAAEPEISYNGQPLTLHQPVIVQEGRTLLALRDMAEQMDVDVQWDNATRLATIVYKDKTITLQPDLQRVLINGEQQQVDVGPQIIEDCIYLPLRYLFEMLDADVFYRSYEDGKTVVAVNSKDSYINYVTTSGRQTKAVRSVDSAYTGNPVVMTHRRQCIGNRCRWQRYSFIPHHANAEPRRAKNGEQRISERGNRHFRG